MCSLKEFFSVCDKFAPLSLSEACKKDGDYDNSGILVNCTDKADKVLFSLDLSEEAVKNAKKKGCDTIVTHHPAIYYPVASLSFSDKVTSAVLLAARYGINVISMHLNLDIACGGNDEVLAKKLGAKKVKLLSTVDGTNGYGRQFSLDCTFGEFVREIKKNFNTDRVVSYGGKNDKIKCVASFCGGGSSYAEKALKQGKLIADTVVTSDMPHHVIKEMTEGGKKIVLLTHYTSEVYGFMEYYENITKEIKGGAETFFFFDRRFK